MINRLAYGDILRNRNARNQRVLFIRDVRGNDKRPDGEHEFLGMTVKPSGRPLGERKVGQIEYFSKSGWIRDE